MEHQSFGRYGVVVLALAGLVLCLGCAQELSGESGSRGSTPITGTSLAVGKVAATGHLAVYPILGERRAEAVELVGFDAALEARTVAVHEIEDGESVGSVTVENRGKESVLILAGTVIRGGKQDRQIGQDFVIAPGEEVAVDAFCVEHGRWDDQREGRATDGAFESGKTLAPKEVREAAHYKSNQGEVWDSVAKENDRRGKQAESGTLMATLDASDVKAAAAALSSDVAKRLHASPDWPRVVGFAYAIDGQIRGGRWFVHHELLRDNEETLLRTMATEAVGVAGAAVPAPAPASVATFLAELRTAKESEVKKTQARNENRYRENARGYSAETVVRVGTKELEVSADYLAK